MKEMTLRRIARECGGILHVPKGREDQALTEVSGIVTDSRQAKEGVLFAAIKGERADGHSFIPQVFAKGALGVLTERELPDDGGCWIQVRSTLEALGQIAEAYRKVLAVPVVGITGSVGKTSTKEMVGSVLSSGYRTLKTAGNFNNELGLPLTIFRLRPEDEMAVLEMGISHFGEMHRLARIARPDICVITNIGQCHLEALGDRDGVLRAKTEIFDFLEPGAKIILNGNDDKLARIGMVKGIRPVFYGFPEERQADELTVWADELSFGGFSGTDCTIHTPEGSFKVHVPLPGRHMVLNAMAACAVGRACGLSHEQIRRGIESLESVGGRLHLLRGADIEIIDDCYNANPVSVKASLEVLREAKGPAVAILGDMAELGQEEISLHRQCGAYAAGCGLKKLIGIGQMSAQTVEAAREKDPEMEAVHFSTVEEFLTRWEEQIPPGSTVLVKASHCMGFDRIVSALKEKRR